MKVCVMGIDPGAKGAVAILSNDPPTRLVWLLSEMSPSIFSEIVKQYEPQHVYLEKAQAMPGQGVSSMFTYGQGFGRLLGWVEMLEIPYTLIAPREWTKDIHKGCIGKDAKEKTLQAMKRIFPKESFLAERGRVPHMGIVDAYAIAEYGRRIFK